MTVTTLASGRRWEECPRSCYKAGYFGACKEQPLAMKRRMQAEIDSQQEEIARLREELRVMEMKHGCSL